MGCVREEASSGSCDDIDNDFSQATKTRTQAKLPSILGLKAASTPGQVFAAAAVAAT